MEEEKSNLVTHAERELLLAGLRDDDTDGYGQLLAKCTLELVTVFAGQRHSGNSAALVTQLFYDLVQFKALSAVTDDPAEWKDVTDIVGGEGKTWQNIRQSSIFSKDGGRTWRDYSTNEMGLSAPKNGDTTDASNQTEELQGSTSGEPSGSGTTDDGGVSAQPVTESKNTSTAGSGKESPSVEPSKPAVVSPEQADGKSKKTSKENN